MDYLTELAIPIFIFSIWTLFCIVYIAKYKRFQLRNNSNKKSFWNNPYIFDAIPPVFPTLGIFCTALGITIGIWNFNTTDIQGSIPQLLKGLRLAFIATMAGIIGLIIFQKIIAVVQKQIDDNPNRPIKETDEIVAISRLNQSIEALRKDNENNIKNLIKSLEEELEQKVGKRLDTIDISITKLSENQIQTNKEIISLKEVQDKASEKANKNTDEIIKAMSENNKLISKKFDEFSELLKKNNTEALVQVMKSATEQFNAQMSELINRLVKENFQELNNSVKSLNEWQKENKEQIQKLTDNFKKTTELFDISSKTLKEVADNTKTLTSEDGKLGQIVNELNRVMIEDGRFQEMSNLLSNTVATLSETTESFDETTSKLNDWVKTEKNFKDAAQILIVKLEEFKDFNGDLWNKYRNEMQKSVSIIKETSTQLSGDLENINSEFYERLNDTLNNLDQCIQRFVPVNRK